MRTKGQEGHPLIVVSLKDVTDKLEEASDHWEQYLNVDTGEFEALPDGMYVEPDEELVEKIEGSDSYVRLPNQYDIHEYSIMERFAEEMPEEQKQTRLFRALRGRRPYRHFKDEINMLGIAEAYYSFLYSALIGIAREWCEDNGIPYRDDTGESR